MRRESPAAFSVSVEGRPVKLSHRAFFLDEAPEPVSLALFGVGVAFLVLMRKKLGNLRTGSQ